MLAEVRRTRGGGLLLAGRRSRERVRTVRARLRSVRRSGVRRRLLLFAARAARSATVEPLERDRRSFTLVLAASLAALADRVAALPRAARRSDRTRAAAILAALVASARGVAARTCSTCTTTGPRVISPRSLTTLVFVVAVFVAACDARPRGFCRATREPSPRSRSYDAVAERAGSRNASLRQRSISQPSRRRSETQMRRPSHRAAHDRPLRAAVDLGADLLRRRRREERGTAGRELGARRRRTRQRPARGRAARPCAPRLRLALVGPDRDRQRGRSRSRGRGSRNERRRTARRRRSASHASR